MTSETEASQQVIFELQEELTTLRAEAQTLRKIAASHDKLLSKQAKMKTMLQNLNQ